MWRRAMVGEDDTVVNKELSFSSDEGGQVDMEQGHRSEELKNDAQGSKGSSDKPNSPQQKSTKEDQSEPDPFDAMWAKLGTTAGSEVIKHLIDRIVEKQSGQNSKGISDNLETVVNKLNDVIDRFAENTGLSEQPILRGALKIEAFPSTPMVYADNEFSVYVVIRNPFPVPIRVYRTETHIPVELYDVIWQRTQEQIIADQRKKIIEETENVIRKIWRRIGFWLADRSRSRSMGPRVAVAVTPEADQKATKRESVSIEGDVNVQDGDVYFAQSWKLNFGDRSDDYISKVLWEVNEYLQGREPIDLQPGNSVVQHFVLRTTNKLPIEPISHTFEIQVRYEVDGLRNVDTIPFALTIKPGRIAPIIGGVFGSLVGAVVKIFSQPETISLLSSTQILMSIAVLIVFGFVIIVGLSRRDDHKQGLVNDYLGGFLFGFFIGYLGDAFVQNLLNMIMPGWE